MFIKLVKSALALVGFVAILGVVFIAGAYYEATSRPKQANPVVPIQIDEKTLWNLINEHRMKLDLPPFIKSQELCKEAKERAVEINYDYTHDQFQNREHMYGVAENIAHAPTAESALRTWLKSPPHRKALEGDWTHSCLACKGEYCAQLFSSFDNKDHSAP